MPGPSQENKSSLRGPGENTENLLLFNMMQALSSGEVCGDKQRRPWFYQARVLLIYINAGDFRIELAL
jgi:hypothetical protein